VKICAYTFSFTNPLTGTSTRRAIENNNPNIERIGDNSCYNGVLFRYEANEKEISVYNGTMYNDENSI